jgi:protein ImuB
LTERLGQPGLHLQRLAKSHVRRELVPAETPLAFRESMELEEPIELLEPLAFILSRLLGQLAERLRARSLATDHVQLDLTLEVHADRELAAEPPPGPVMTLFQRVLKLPVPTQDAKVLLKLLQLDLSAHPPAAPVKKVSIEAFPARLRFVQAGLFEPLAPEPAKLEITLARLRAVVGEKDNEDRNRVGFPARLDSHRPDSFAVLPIGYRRSESGKPSSRSCLALRWFRPVLDAWIEFSGGLPATVAFNHINATVLRASGPWRSTGAWWDENRQWQHDEWDLHLSIGGGIAVYRVFCDLHSRQWFVAGMYD